MSRSKSKKDTLFYIDLALNGGPEGQMVAAKFFSSFGASKSHDAKLKLLEGGGIETLITLMFSEEIRVLRETARALVQLVQSRQICETLCEKGGSRGFANLLQSFDVVVQALAAQVCGVICSQDSCLKTFVRDGGLLPLLSLLQVSSEPDEATKRDSERRGGSSRRGTGGSAWTNKDESSSPTIHGGGRMLPLSVWQSRKEVIKEAAIAVSKFWLKDDISLHMLTVWCIGPLLALLRTCPLGDVQRAALAAIAHLCTSNKLVTEIVRQGVFEYLVYCLQSTDVGVRREASNVCYSLAVHDSIRPNFFQSSYADIMHSLLSLSFEEDFTVRCSHEKTLDVLAQDKDMAEMVDAYASLAFFSSLFKGKGGGPHICTLALQQLISGGFITHDSSQRVIEAGLIPVLLPLTQGVQTPEVRTLAVKALHACACIDSLRNRLIQADACPSLVQLMGFKVSATKLWSLKTVAELSKRAETHDHILKVGGLHPIVSLLNSGEDEFLLPGMQALANMANHPVVAHKYFIRGGGLRRFISLMDAEDPDIVRACIKALYNFAASPGDSRLKIVAEGALEHLTFILDETEDNEAVTISAKLLFSILDCDLTRASFKQIEKQLSAMLVQCLRKEVPSACKYIIKTVATCKVEMAKRVSTLELVSCTVVLYRKARDPELRFLAAQAILFFIQLVPTLVASCLSEWDSFKSLALADFQNILVSEIEQRKQALLDTTSSSLTSTGPTNTPMPSFVETLQAKLRSRIEHSPAPSPKRFVASPRTPMMSPLCGDGMRSDNHASTSHPPPQPLVIPVIDSEHHSLSRPAFMSPKIKTDRSFRSTISAPTPKGSQTARAPRPQHFHVPQRPSSAAPCSPMALQTPRRPQTSRPYFREVDSPSEVQKAWQLVESSLDVTQLSHEVEQMMGKTNALVQEAKENKPHRFPGHVGRPGPPPPIVEQIEKEVQPRTAKIGPIGRRYITDQKRVGFSSGFSVPEPPPPRKSLSVGT